MARHGRPQGEFKWLVLGGPASDSDYEVSDEETEDVQILDSSLLGEADIEIDEQESFIVQQV